MDFRFIHQRTPNKITTLDVIELYNCSEEGYSPGEYTVGDIDVETGDVTVFGIGEINGCIAVISLGEPE